VFSCVDSYLFSFFGALKVLLFRLSKKTQEDCLGTLQRYERIEEMKDDYRIEVLSEAFCVSRSGFHQWLQRRNKPSARLKEDLELAEQIGESSIDKVTVHRGCTSSFVTVDATTAVREIDRIRRELGLCGRQKRRYRPKTTDSSHDEPIAPNRLTELPEVRRRDGYDARPMGRHAA
jgi:DNA-binding transcriptional regulator YiaG